MDSPPGFEFNLKRLADAQPASSHDEARRGWAQAFRRRHLDGLAAWLLEASRPLSLISAQVLYMGAPFLGRRAENLARLLESDRETAQFIEYLDDDPDGVAAGRQGDA